MLKVLKIVQLFYVLFLYMCQFNACVQVRESDVQRILCWEEHQKSAVEVPFRPARVLLQVINS